MQRLWYVAYGSNLSLDRFRVYLRGGRPVGGAREYPGCRDPLGPDRDVPVMLRGGLRFVGVSSVWGGGGMAVYDGGAVGQVAARAYQISAEQFVDILAQEMRLEPDLDADLTAVRETGRHSLGPGRYQTLAHLGDRDGLPMLTFTSADVDHRVNAPSEGYLRTIASGLRESHGWTSSMIGSYLARFPGAAGSWSPRSIESLVA